MIDAGAGTGFDAGVVRRAVAPRCASAALTALGIAFLAAGASAQTPTMPSTLRYGSGLIDIPVSSVLPHLTITGTFSGFFSRLDRRVEIDPSGSPSGFGAGRDRFYSDGSVAIGLFDRAEAGVTLQSFADADAGGKMWGVFGRVRLWEPIDQGLGLAVGGRYVTSPSYNDGVAYAPGRLGFPDRRLRERYTGLNGVKSNLSLYGVATAYLRGYDGGPLPENDMTFSLGYGGGSFSEGGEVDFYSSGHANGWFMGTAFHIGMRERTQLTLMAEHNGFDVNVGAHVDWDGLRVGAQYLASNHQEPTGGHYSEFQQPKFGVLASVAICPTKKGFRCRPRMMARIEPDTIFMRAPPPDTVIVRVPEGAAPVFEGREVNICLSTGQNIPLRVTIAGDTLVGRAGLPIRLLRPGLVFAGRYAGNAFWYQNDEVITFEGDDFARSAETFPIDCDQILRVGVYQGIPIFGVISARRPLDVLFVPVRPGVWHRYERGGGRQ